ncbi:transmembrane amino acid transporter protein-domain-containing protein [Thamnocephalis sphaerospora]|uniref:Transmembrane amino acid transporter protein-domain-containing protein n=1 Tax=Thamnocephalis sphaerospora TaxID=78915 RepID=A0A4P9XMQ6_9FUNG|nr:transmembrane amino acid transporter protein-domain-containing protein [Thamnocephalis sphaerospora]|eukprot:RKP07203.1 transmembrane amino acid transporter protein-domain-containing protein [Thamnocephalis sphaerospora]
MASLAPAEMQIRSSFDSVKEAKQEHEGRTGSSFGAYFNIISVCAGVGTLQLPYVLNLGGWIGLVLFVLAACMAIYTGTLLIRCLYAREGTRLSSYPAVGREAFGRVGHILVMFFNYTLLVGGGSIYVMLSGMNLAFLFPNVPLSPREWMAVSAAVILLPLLLLKTLKEAAILSVFGTLTTAAVAVITAALCGTMLGDEGHQAAHSLVNVENLPVALATISFAYSGNMVYPHVEESMRHPGSWSRVLTSAVATITAIYVTISVPAYLALGSDTLSPITLHLPAGTASFCANVLITIHVLLAAPILITSFTLDLERAWGIEVQRIGRVKEFLGRAFIRTASVTVAALIAMYMPSFGSFMSLLGAIDTCMLVFVLPIICYMRLFGWRSIRPLELVWCAIILIIGLMGCVLGSISAVKEMMEETTN